LVTAAFSLALGLRGAVAAEPAREWVVDPMAALSHWQVGGRRVNYVLGESAVSVSPEQPRPGVAAALKLTYDFREPQRDYLSLYWTGLPIPGPCESVSFWLYGDGSGRPLSLAIEDAAGRWYDRGVGVIEGSGWRQITVPVGDGTGWRALRRHGEAVQPLAHPVWLRQIAVERGAATALQGAVYCSDLRALTTAGAVDFVEAEISSGQPAGLLNRDGGAVFTVTLSNRGTEAAAGQATLRVSAFRRLFADLGAQPFAVAPGQSATLRFDYRPEQLGAHTVTLILSGPGRQRVFAKPFGVMDAADPPLAAGLGTFGGHAATHSLAAGQLETAFRLNRQAGIGWERLSFNWQYVEPAPGVFVWDPPPSVAGVKGQAVRGPGNLATAADPRLDLQDAVTLAFWMRADRHPGDWQWPVLKYADEPYRNYGVFLDRDTGVASFTAAFERGDRSPYWGLSSGWSPWDGQWHHFAATYAADTGTAILYVDGREIKREVLDGGRLRTGKDGVRLASSYTGELDEVVLCDRALAATEIAALAAHQDPPAAGLCAWWSFDDADDPGQDRGLYRLHASAGRRDWMLAAADQAQAHGMRILGILGFPPAWGSTAPAGAARPWVYKPKLPDWERYVEATTRQFAGMIDHWEIWNEPNISVFWEPTPDAKEFLEVVRTGYAAAKRGNPACTVVTPGLAGAGEYGGDFMGELIRSGVVPSCDALSIHPYRQTTPEESDLVGDLTRLAALCEQHGGRRPLWLTEWCWTTEIPGGSTEERSALLTGRGIVLALGTGLVDRIFWFRLADPGTDRFYSEDNYGLCYNDLTPRPAYFALRTCARLLDGARPAAELTLSPGLWSRQFQRSPGSRVPRNPAAAYGDAAFQPGDEYILALWAPTNSAMVALPTGLRSVPVVDLMGNEREVPTRDGVLFLEASEALQFVRLPQALTTAVAPVELRAPPRLLAGETAELRLLLSNPLAQATQFAIELGGLVERQVVTTVAAQATQELAIPCTPAATLPPGPQAVTLQIRGAESAWSQRATVWVTSIRPGEALIGHWRFDEGQGTVAHDATPNALHGQIAGCQWVPGRQGMALAFSGSSAAAVGGPAGALPVPDLVEVPAAAALNLPEEATVAFWIKLTGDTGSWQFPVTKFRGNLARNYGVYLRPGDFSAYFSTSFVGAATPHVDVGGGPNLNDGQWHHLAATSAVAAGQIAVYVDGRRVGSQGVSPDLMRTVDEPLRFGAGTKGILDEVRVYGRALSPAEIQRLAEEP
jgi:hypothetical protein